MISASKFNLERRSELWEELEQVRVLFHLPSRESLRFSQVKLRLMVLISKRFLWKCSDLELLLFHKIQQCLLVL